MTDTQTQLDTENEARRSRIRALRVEIISTQNQLVEQFHRYTQAGFNYPPRGWDERYQHEIERRIFEMRRLAEEIATLSAGPGYFLLRSVEVGDAERVLEEIV